MGKQFLRGKMTGGEGLSSSSLPAILLFKLVSTVKKMANQFLSHGTLALCPSPSTPNNRINSYVVTHLLGLPQFQPTLHVFLNLLWDTLS